MDLKSITIIVNLRVESNMDNSAHNFVIYKSSAGSGKTFTLVKEYLKLALNDIQLPPQHYKKILAITFTNKAAGEMKERIIRALTELSEGKNLTLLKILSDEINLDEATIKKRADALLSDILHNYGNFAISTIDSFTHNIIRNFSHDLKLPVNFDIETDESTVIARCADQLISQIGVNEEITELIIEFSKSKTEEQKSWQVDKEIKSFADKILRHSDTEHASGLRELGIKDFTAIRKKLYDRNKTFEKEMQEAGSAFFRLLKNNSIQSTDFFQGEKGIPGYFKKLAENRFDDKNLFGSYVLKTINEGKWYSPKKGNESVQTAIDSIASQITELYNASSLKINDNLSNYIIRRSVLRDLYSLSLINEIEKLVREFKEEENILFISEFNQRISEIISSEPVPFIYEKIGERYKHFLLDEFQDTSAMQWQNLLPLIDNTLSEGNYNLIVGDGKQSIYRWRGGEAEQFDALPELPLIANSSNKPYWENNLKRNAAVKQLASNFRSLPEVIGFNNRFFEWLSENQLHDQWKKIYSSVKQLPRENISGGFVTLDFFGKDVEEDKALITSLGYIHQNLNTGYKLKDIVIIVRRNSEGNKVADFLTAHNIPVISSDSLLLKNADEIRFITNMLQLLAQPEDAVTASSIINFLSDKEVISGKSKNDFFLQLNQGNLSFNFRKIMIDEGIAFNSAELISLPLLECVIKIIELFHITTNKSYIQFFLDEIIRFTAYNTNSISAFLESWENSKKTASLKIPEGSDAVRIITIHKSKGLEFPVVIIPFCNWAYLNNDYIWIEPGEELEAALIRTSSELERTKFAGIYEEEKQKQVLDNINLLYVAFTRAANHLHIIAQAPASNNPNVYSFVRNFASEVFQLSETENSLKLGEPVFINEKHKELNSFDYKLELNDWNNIISIKSGYEETGISSGKESRETGVLMHYLLSKINTSSDISTAIKHCTEQGLIAAGDAQELESELKELITSETISPFFQEGQTVLNETEILSQHGNVLRPDRLILKENSTLIIDFKTGKHSDAYISQLDSYAAALEEMGYPQPIKYLIYLNERKVVVC